MQDTIFNEALLTILSKDLGNTSAVQDLNEFLAMKLHQISEAHFFGTHSLTLREEETGLSYGPGLSGPATLGESASSLEYPSRV